MTQAETHDEFRREDYVAVHDLETVEVDVTTLDVSILLRVYTTRQEFAFKLTRAGFLNLSEYLASEARRIKGH